MKCILSSLIYTWRKQWYTIWKSNGGSVPSPACLPSSPMVLRLWFNLPWWRFLMPLYCWICEVLSFWTAADLACWGSYLLFTALQEHCQAKTIRALNNTVRDELYHSFLRKSHTDFHQFDTGEYLARLTNDVKQLEQLAWIPFFGCVGKIAQIVFSVLGLAFLHWSLVVFSVITSLAIWSNSIFNGWSFFNISVHLGT